jgi:hypothetical protein
LTYDADKYWETAAAVVPVLALAFVVEIRYMQFHRLTPFTRLNIALTHALTICLLLWALAASLFHLMGWRQAPWAESVAFYGILVSLSVILITPVSRLLMLGLYSNTPSDYVFYWKQSRKLRRLQRELRQVARKMAVEERKLGKYDAMLSEWPAKHPFVPVVDLQSAWRNAEIASGQEDLERTREKFAQDLEDGNERIRKMKSEVREAEKQLIEHSGRGAKLIMEMMDKQSGAVQ